MDTVLTNYTALQPSHRCEKVKQAMRFVSICLRARWHYFAWNVKQFSNWTADGSGGHEQVNAFPKLQRVTAHVSKSPNDRVAGQTGSHIPSVRIASCGAQLRAGDNLFRTLTSAVYLPQWPRSVHGLADISIRTCCLPPASDDKYLYISIHLHSECLAFLPALWPTLSGTRSAFLKQWPVAFNPYSITSVNVKFSVYLINKAHAIRTYGEWRYSSTILVLGIRYRWVVSFTPWPL
jgi:hypothetical protein